MQGLPPCCFESAHIIWVSALFWLEGGTEGGGLVIEVRCVTFIWALWSPAGCASFDCVFVLFFFLFLFFFAEPEPLFSPLSCILDPAGK